MKNQTKSNDLRYTATRTVGNESITVKIRLNDECKNGHQDFSVTGEVYQAGKPRTDRNMISCGCVHDHIAKAFPEFIPFIRLHLADAKGVPMYAVENGYYNLSRIDNYCEEYRITPEQLATLRTARSQTQFALMIISMGILQQWENDANTAIAELEKLTRLTFVNDSKKSQFHAPTPEEIAEEEKREKEGYYTPYTQQLREDQKKRDQFTNLQNERLAEIAKINLKYDVLTEVLTKGGADALENCIFYEHTKELAFNWRGYGDELATEFINELFPTLVLPEGVTAKISDKKR